MRKLTALAVFLTFSGLAFDAQAQSNTRSQQILVVSNTAGACRLMKSLIAFSETPDFKGDKEAIEKFQAAEAASMGKTVDDYTAQCEKAITVYGELWQKANKQK